MKKNDLIVVEKNGFLNKIKKLFSGLKSLFKGKQYADITEESGKIAQERLSNDFKNGIKENVTGDVEFFKQNNIEEFLKEIRRDKTLLDNLSTDRLIKLKGYLENDVKEKRNHLCELIRIANTY